MSGYDGWKLPKFLEGEPLPEDYHDPVNPYEPHPRCPYNLQKLMRYAFTSGRRIEDMTKEEIMRFVPYVSALDRGAFLVLAFLIDLR